VADGAQCLREMVNSRARITPGAVRRKKRRQGSGGDVLASGMPRSGSTDGYGGEVPAACLRAELRMPAVAADESDPE